MKNVDSNASDLMDFELPRIVVWFYFLIVGFPLAVILLLVDSFNIAFTNKPMFIHNLPKFSMTYKEPRQPFTYHERNIPQRIILGLVGFIIGMILLSISLLLSILGLFKPAAEVQERIIHTIFPKSDRQDRSIATGADSISKTNALDEVEPEPISSKKCQACGQENEFSAIDCIDCGSNLPAKNI